MVDTQGEQETKIVLDSTLFDADCYRRASRLNEGSELELCEHYLLSGERAGLAPSDSFDPRFYLSWNPDVAEAGVSPLVHYLRYGKTDGRFACEKDVVATAGVLRSALEKAGFSNYAGRRKLLLGKDPLVTYLLSWRQGFRLFEWFDDEFYVRFYPDVADCGRPPFFHFIIDGRCDGRVGTKNELDRIVEIIEPDLDARHYLEEVRARIGETAAQDLKSASKSELAMHYLQQGYAAACSPSPSFDVRFYLTEYRDIATTPTEPYSHFVGYGRKEGRHGLLDFGNILEEGGRRFEGNKKTLLIACHEASRTGAPLVGLNLAAELSEHYNIILYLLRGGELLGSFAAECCLLVKGAAVGRAGSAVLEMLKRDYGLSGMILNSVETDAVAAAAVGTGIPCVALVHEFAEYTRPQGRVADMVRRCHRIVVPARIIESSLQNEVENVCCGRATHVRISPQGKLPWIPTKHLSHDLSVDEIKGLVVERCGPNRKIVLGAGFIGIRKGVELFLQIAAAAAAHSDQIAFIWIGAGPAKDDVSYVVWINETLKRMRLEKTVLMLPEQGSLDAAFECTDLFLLSSRLDPFPNVVIDALDEGKPVVCFRDASGFAELIDDGQVVGRAVPYGDVGEAARAVVSCLSLGSDIEKNKQFVRNALDFTKYVGMILDELGQARLVQDQLEKQVADLEASRAFDASYYQGEYARSPLRPLLVADYVMSASRGLARRNGRPGSSENLKWSQLLAGKLQTGAAALPIETHRCIDLGEISAPGVSKSKILIHVHLHYADLAVEFARRLKGLRRDTHVVVTVTSEAAQRDVKEAFGSLYLKNLDVVLVPNKGRDLGPFLFDVLQRSLDEGIDIIAHLHGKKSVDIGVGVGASWRDYLLDQLLGQSGELVEPIIGLFERDPKLGLVFVEDPYCVGWSENLALAQGLAERMHPRPHLADRPFFPLGTMFWARPSAIGSLVTAFDDRDRLPAEPLPYDGTILHAIERMFPSIVESMGFGWATVRHGGRWR